MSCLYTHNIKVPTFNINLSKPSVARGICPENNFFGSKTPVVTLCSAHRFTTANLYAVLRSSSNNIHGVFASYEPGLYEEKSPEGRRVPFSFPFLSSVRLPSPKTKPYSEHVRHLASVSSSFRGLFRENEPASACKLTKIKDDV